MTKHLLTYQIVQDETNIVESSGAMMFDSEKDMQQWIRSQNEHPHLHIKKIGVSNIELTGDNDNEIHKI